MGIALRRSGSSAGIAASLALWRVDAFFWSRKAQTFVADSPFVDWSARLGADVIPPHVSAGAVGRAPRAPPRTAHGSIAAFPAPGARGGSTPLSQLTGFNPAGAGFCPPAFRFL